MNRVKIVVEGLTEESFVSQVLAPILWPHKVYVTPILLGVPGHKGGRTNYARVKKDIVLYLKQDQTAYCSTMLDYYGLGPGFPGTLVPSGLPAIDQVAQIEQAVKDDICQSIPEFRPDVRFIPFIQLHEYEGLLFSDPQVFASAIEQPHLAREFQRVRDQFPTPEDIDDGQATAPSKRVLQIYRSYNKVLHGITAANRIGVQAMRTECPHFRNWLEQLESLGPE
ncbi:MAG TPA: DUF4276 family protein [Bryobacteraceae bacterium]|nr:DUF4276 family protein [Bryobacteraceae bacterium]